ncbi:MAG: hypothetical protein IJS09_01120 [Treponema sp.]|nr:hypothetical protein [Treponema sp.]
MALSASAADFSQRLEWKADKNVLEYKVEIQSASGKAVKTIQTETNFVEFSLPAGQYRYRVHAYDFLGREARTSEWTNFDILKASTPEITLPKESVDLSADSKTLEMPVTITDVTGATTVELVNEATGKVIKGTLSGSAAVGAVGSETARASKAQFKNVPEGEWKLRVTNPSGLASESPSFSVVDRPRIEKERVAEEKAAAKQAEKEQIAAQKEAERIAKEEEKERVVAQKEAERVAKEEEKERIAAEKEAERVAKAEEEERIAAEKEAAKAVEEEKKAAEKEQKKAEKEQQKAEKIAKRLYNDSKVLSLSAGVGGSDILTGGIRDYNDKTFVIPAFKARILSLPFRRDKNHFGLALSVEYEKLLLTENFYNAELSLIIGDASLVYRRNFTPTNRWFWQVKAGGGVTFVSKGVTYKQDAGDRKAGEDNLFFYPTIVGGLSFGYIPVGLLSLEAGVDLSCIMIPELTSVLVTPYVSLGIRL